MKNMKKPINPRNGISAVIAALALAASGSHCLAASTVVLNTFDNSGDLGSWQANGSTLQWVNQDAAGNAGSGSMMVAYTNNGTIGWQSPQPQRNLGAQAFATSNYWSVSFDFKIDPNSSPGADAPFGHVQ